ncbi:tyrosinase family oxidase copper chaperone [Streptomyces sp. YIM S03343]
MAAYRSGPESPPRRRDLTRGLLATAAALVLTPVLAASRPPQDGAGTGTTAGTGVGGGAGSGAGGAVGSAADDLAFAETYRGRRIKGIRTPAGLTAETVTEEWQVTVDGRPLHLMRRADGSWLSMVDHYRSYPTPLAAARAAVDEMGPKERLRELAPGPMDDMGPRTGGHRTHLHADGHMGGDRGVHA